MSTETENSNNNMVKTDDVWLANWEFCHYVRTHHKHSILLLYFVSHKVNSVKAVQVVRQKGLVDAYEFINYLWDWLDKNVPKWYLENKYGERAKKIREFYCG